MTSELSNLATVYLIWLASELSNLANVFSKSCNEGLYYYGNKITLRSKKGERKYEKLDNSTNEVAETTSNA